MNKHSKKKAVIISYIATILNYAAMFFVVPITIRMLGKQEFGLYSLVNSVVGYLALLSLGLGSAYIRFYFRAKTDKHSYKVENLNGMYFLSYVIIAFAVIILGVIFIIFSENIFGPKLTIEEHQTAKVLLAILIFNLATTFLFSIFWSYTRAIEHFVTLEIANLLKVVLGPAVTIPLLLLGFGSVGFVAGTTAITTLIEISVMIYAIKKGRITFKFNYFDKVLLKEIVVYSLFIFGFQLLDQINNGVDNLILGWTGGTEVVSIYAVGATIAYVILSLPNGIKGVIVPEINKISFNDENKLEKISLLQTRYGRIIFMILALVLLGFVLLGLPFLDLWAGVGFSDSYLIVILLVLARLINYSLVVSSEFIRAENRHKTRLTIYAITILLNVIVSIPLAIWLGPVGTAIGTAFTYTIYTIFLYFYYIRKIGLNLNILLKQLIKMAVIYVLVFTPFYVATFFVQMKNIMIFLAIGGGFTSIFLIVNYLFVMNEYERGIIKTLLRIKRKTHSQS